MSIINLTSGKLTREEKSFLTSVYQELVLPTQARLAATKGTTIQQFWRTNLSYQAMYTLHQALTEGKQLPYVRWTYTSIKAFETVARRWYQDPTLKALWRTELLMDPALYAQVLEYRPKAKPHQGERS